MKHRYSNHDRERELQKELQANVEIPAIVRDKALEAYRMIENRQVIQKEPPKDFFHWMKTGAKAAGAMAAILVLGFVICAANPVMARELPLVGSLFERLQNEVSFFGNFAEDATVLEEPGAAEKTDSDSPETVAADTSKKTNHSVKEYDASAADGTFTKTSSGLTITFSEVFANSQAVYLTMLVKSEEPFPDTMSSKTDIGSERPEISMVYSTAYSFLDNPEGICGRWPLEGVFLDKNAYSCILRLDLSQAVQDTAEYSVQQQALSQQIMEEMGVSEENLNDDTEENRAILEEYMDRFSARSGALQSYIREIPLPVSFTLHLGIQELIGQKSYGDYTEEEVQSMSYEEYFNLMQYRYEGDWDFDIPITIDDSKTITLDLNETNEEGIGLKSVIKTPYELTVNELYEEGSDSDSFLVALDAKGNRLPYNASGSSCNNFAIQDKDISTVDIYILDYTQYMDELKGPERYINNENKPEEEKWSTLLAENAKYHKTIHFD